MTQAPAPAPQGPGEAQEAAVVLLAAASGAVDATAFMALGHVFAGVMTGNLALLGIAVGGSRPGEVVPPVVALAGFVAGTASAALACRGGRQDARGLGWPWRVTAALVCEILLLTAAAAVWAVCGAAPSEPVRDVLLGLVAVSMGIQSGAMLGAGPAARPSTYLTGALATFVTRGVGRVPGGGAPGPNRWVPVRLTALAVGAGAAAVTFRLAPAWTGALPPALVAAALATVAVGAATR